MPYRLLYLLTALLAGCGLSDSAMVECRCAPDTSTLLFPHCGNVENQNSRPDPQTPLSTQIPDCPSGQQLFLLERIRPESVLANIRSIFQGKPETRSPEQYMDHFATNFIFTPDPEDVQLHPEIYSTENDTLWGPEQERSFARAILDPERIQSARFLRWFEASKDERIPSEDQLQETFIFPYEVEFIEIVPTTDENETATTLNVIGIKGFMEMDLVTPTVENPVWSVAAWRDLRDRASAKFSWGELRAVFVR
jgi:hypothetical protein